MHRGRELQSIGRATLHIAFLSRLKQIERLAVAMSAAIEVELEARYYHFCVVKSF